MINLIDTFKELLLAIKQYPERYNELAEMVKATLNNGFDNKIICEKVFISKGNDEYTEPLTVIPVMPVSDILEIDTIKYYDLEINISNLSEDNYTVEEYISWLIHELCENIITDKTLTRFKKMLISKYNQNEPAIKSVVRNIGYLVWAGVFSRTAKESIDSMINDFFSNYLKNNSLDYLIDSWNSALNKYPVRKALVIK